MSACVEETGQKEREVSLEHMKSEGLNPLWLPALNLLPSAAPRRSHSSPPYPPLGTWICCTMVRSCTRNSLASLALSDNPFSAWESWLCGEKQGRTEMPSQGHIELLQNHGAPNPGALEPALSPLVWAFEVAWVGGFWYPGRQLFPGLLNTLFSEAANVSGHRSQRPRSLIPTSRALISLVN